MMLKNNLMMWSILSKNLESIWHPWCWIWWTSQVLRIHTLNFSRKYSVIWCYVFQVLCSFMSLLTMFAQPWKHLNAIMCVHSFMYYILCCWY